MPDLRLGASVSDELEIEEYDLWRSGDMETSFFAPLEEAAEAEGKPKKKVRKNARTRSGSEKLPS